MKINTSHLVGAVIVLAAVFFSKLDAQDTPAQKASRDKWVYMVLQVQNSHIEKHPEGSVRVKSTYGGESWVKQIEFINSLSEWYDLLSLCGATGNGATKGDVLRFMGNLGWEFVCFEDLPLIESRGKALTYNKDWTFKRPKL